MKATDNSYYRLKYEQISKRRGKKLAIIVIVRMPLTAVYRMLITSEIWKPTYFFKADVPESLKSLKEKQLSKAVQIPSKTETYGFLIPTRDFDSAVFCFFAFFTALFFSYPAVFSFTLVDKSILNIQEAFYYTRKYRRNTCPVHTNFPRGIDTAPLTVYHEFRLIISVN